MSRAATIAFTVVLLLVVIAVFISPLVDLPPTALRAVIWVAALFATLTIPRIVFSGLPHGLICGYLRIPMEGASLSPPLVDLNCARLC